MTDIIVEIMVEVLSILAIATKEIKQGRASELFPGYKSSVLANDHPEAFLKKLAGRTDIEDALGRLDRLTQEEARMAAAQGLRATREVDDRVKAVDDKLDVVIDGA